MNEELIISGRENLGVDPQLHIWHWPIPLYLFLGGLAAGVLFFAALYYLLGKENEFRTAVRRVPFVAPIALVIGLAALFIDLRHKAYFWQLYTTIRLESPMSWGAWTLLVITTTSFIWCALHIREFFPNWDWKYSWLKDIEVFFNKHKKPLAWVIMIFAIITGVYTGILLSAFNARPLWNTSVLGPHFLASGLSAGAATIVLSSRNSRERLLFTKIDLVILGVELFLIVHMFMGFLASTQVQIEAAGLFLGGPYTMVFWIFVVVLGIIIPAVLDLMELRGLHIPAVIPGILVVFGSLMFRFIFVFAGQVSRWLY
jgi:formate-dependent nitrite reductase membrane component NrfD